MWLGLILYTSIPWFIVFSIAFFWIYYERIMFAEEQYLKNKFGKTFENWANETPAFIPDIRKWQKPELPFSFKNILRKEYSGFFAMIISFVWINFIKYYFIKGAVKIDIWWIIAGVIGCTAYIILRSLKKYTLLLNVNDR